MSGFIAQSSYSFKQSGTGAFSHKDDPVFWSDKDILRLREGILIDAIRRLLDGRVSAKSRGELVSWIQDDALSPFCFRVCSMTVTVDPDLLREYLIGLLEKHGEDENSQEEVIWLYK